MTKFGQDFLGFWVEGVVECLMTRAPPEPGKAQHVHTCEQLGMDVSYVWIMLQAPVVHVLF